MRKKRFRASFGGQVFSVLVDSIIARRHVQDRRGRVKSCPTNSSRAKQKAVFCLGLPVGRLPVGQLSSAYKISAVGRNMKSLWTAAMLVAFILRFAAFV